MKEIVFRAKAVVSKPFSLRDRLRFLFTGRMYAAVSKVRPGAEIVFTVHPIPLGEVKGDPQ